MAAVTDPLAYAECLPEPLRAEVDATLVDVEGVPGLRVDPALAAAFPALHTADVLGVVADIARELAPALRDVLAARRRDRAFVDAYTLAAAERNEGVPFTSPDYVTVIGAHDDAGRRVVGPHDTPPPVSPVTMPAMLAGPAVTLFGPPDDARMCVNAMNALHRRRPEEPPIVQELVERSGLVPFWGADSEDSKTPLLGDLLAATHNLSECVRGTLSAVHPRSGKRYELAESGRSVPIKRIPGLGLPDALHQLDGRPLPLHLVDLVLHALHCEGAPASMAFYVPKLENEEEAAYVAALVRAVEQRLAQRHPGFELGTTRLFVVFETPRAIFRIAEMAEALHPFLAGGSLGWHDFLAATARLFKHDANYRIPVKADPDIVIRHIKESHLTLVRALRPRGATCIGGMYGTLFEDGNEASFRISMVGYVRDVVTQLKRGLDGFWVAHPDFVRIGIALVAAWQEGLQVVEELVSALVPDPVELQPLLDFVRGPDVDGLDPDDPLYRRRVLAADLPPDDPAVTNHTHDEVAYNVFQALQYLAGWLQGTGCVALPASVVDRRGDRVFVRVMDDLATTERSRWELWHEVAHGRVSAEAFEQVLAEEVAFLQAGVDTPTKRVQVPWNDVSDRWYRIAVRLLRQLVRSDEPVESVSELLVPFTLDPVRLADDPWEAAQRLCPGHFRA
jgi:malate synthase